MDDFSTSPLRGAAAPRSDQSAQIEIKPKTPLDDFRTWRYAQLRAIAIPVPCLPVKVPLIGGRSAAELLIMGFTALIFIILVFSQKSFLDICIAICVVLALRNNILDLLFGISFERAIYFHRFFGVVACIMLWIHAILENFGNLSGIGLLITVFSTSLLYLIKPYIFELFYYLHIMLYCSIIPLTVIHGAPYTAFASIAWALDLIVRYLVTGKSIEAEIVPMSEGITQIRFKKNFDYAPGQFCFVRIPEIAFMEYHPFSFATAPLEEDTAFAIRSSGDWTKRLYDHAKNNPKKSLSVQIEGPFGRPSIDLDSGLYKVLVLVCGGIGITPMVSLFNHLILQAENTCNRDSLRKVILVSSSRGRAFVHSFAAPLQESARRPGMLLSSLMKGACKALSDKQATSVYSAEELFQADFYNTSSSNNNNDGDETAAEREEGAVGLAPNQTVISGRPKFASIFREVAALCAQEQLSRAGVCVCGPEGLIDEVRDLCKQSRINGKVAEHSVVFDCHTEVFDF